MNKNGVVIYTTLFLKLFKFVLDYTHKVWYYNYRKEVDYMTNKEKVKLLIAILVLVIAMLSIALWSSCYINRLDTYYFNEYLNDAQELEH